MFYEHKNSKLNYFSFIFKEANIRVLQPDLTEHWSKRKAVASIDHRSSAVKVRRTKDDEYQPVRFGWIGL